MPIITVPRTLGGTLLLTVNTGQPPLPNATLLIRKGTADMRVRSGQATFYIRSGEATIEVREQ